MIISKSTIEEVRNGTDVVALVEETVSLKRSGSSWKGLCPFHDESTPSMHVNPARGLWHCFGCGEGGDVIDFVKKRDALTFAEAVETLATRLNVEVEYVEGTGFNKNLEGLSGKKLAKMNELASEWFHQNWLKLPEDHPGKTFLKTKNLLTSELVETFNLGWAPHPSENMNGWGGVWNGLSMYLVRECGFEGKDLIEGGLASQNQKGELYDKFRGRIIWPVRSLQGNVVAFGGRRIYEGDREGPKYLNSPETVLYKKSDVLYNLEKARKFVKKSKTLVVVEGYTDVMALTAAGVPSAVAACGTAFGATHAQTLKRALGDDLTKTSGVGSGTVSVVFMFDGDTAGKQAALRVSETMTSLFTAEMYAVTLPAGEDPSDIYKKEGGGKILQTYTESRTTTLTRFAIDTKLGNHNVSTPEGVALAVGEISELLSKISNPIVKDQYVRIVASELKISPSEISNNVQRAQWHIKQREQYNTQRSHSATQVSAVQNVLPLHANPLNSPDGNPNYVNEEETVLLTLQNPKLLHNPDFVLEREAFTSPALRAVYTIALTATANPAMGEKLTNWRDALRVTAESFHFENDNDINDVKRLINQLLTQSPKILTETPEVLSQHTVEVFRKTSHNYMNRKIMELKREQLSHEPTSEQYLRVWEKIMQLEQKKKQLN